MVHCSLLSYVCAARMELSISLLKTPHGGHCPKNYWQDVHFSIMLGISSLQLKVPPIGQQMQSIVFELQHVHIYIPSHP